MLSLLVSSFATFLKGILHSFKGPIRGLCLDSEDILVFLPTSVFHREGACFTMLGVQSVSSQHFTCSMYSLAGDSCLPLTLCPFLLFFLGLLSSLHPSFLSFVQKLIPETSDVVSSLSCTFLEDSELTSSMSSTTDDLHDSKERRSCMSVPFFWSLSNFLVFATFSLDPSHFDIESKRASFCTTGNASLDFFSSNSFISSKIVSLCFSVALLCNLILSSTMPFRNSGCRRNSHIQHLKIREMSITLN